MNDKTLGYGVIIALILFLFVPVSYLAWQTKSSVQFREIQFKQIRSLNFLNKQDPVRINGVVVGDIRKVYTKNNKTYVQIAINLPVKFYKDYKITSTMKGLLGERYIDIQPGNPESGTVGEKEILNGIFVTGLSDAVAYINKLNSIINSIVQFSSNLRYGSQENISFIDQFETIVSKFDSLIVSINTFSKTFDSKLEKSMDTLNVLLKKTSDHTQTISSSIPDIFKDCNQLIEKTNLLVLQLDTLITKGNSVVSSLNRSETGSWEKHLEKIQINLEKLRGLIKMIEAEELRLPVRL